MGASISIENSKGELIMTIYGPYSNLGTLLGTLRDEIFYQIDKPGGESLEIKADKLCDLLSEFFKKNI